MAQDQNTENMKLDPSVIDTIVSLTASDTEGVAIVGTPTPSGFFSKLFNKPSTSGIECKMGEDGKLSVVLHIEVYFGYSIPELAEKLRQAIADTLLVQAGVEVSNIDIYVDGIQFNQNW